MLVKAWLSPAATTPEPTPPGGRAAVYRFYNTITGTHFFSPGARQNATSSLGLIHSSTTENVAFYAYADAANGRSPIFRFYNNRHRVRISFPASVAERTS